MTDLYISLTSQVTSAAQSAKGTLKDSSNNTVGEYDATALNGQLAEPFEFRGLADGAYWLTVDVYDEHATLLQANAFQAGPFYVGTPGVVLAASAASAS